MYCFVLHIGIYKYCTNNKETHKACAWFQHANTTKHSTWPDVSMSLFFFFRKNLSADNRHSNEYELCPFSRWHLSILIRSGFHTVFALNGKETVSISVQSHSYIDDVLSINNREFENYMDQMYPAELEIKELTEQHLCFLPRFTPVVWEWWSVSHFHLRQTRLFQFPHHKLSVPEQL